MVCWPKDLVISFVSHWSLVAQKAWKGVKKGALTRKCINAKFLILTLIFILAANKVKNFVKTTGAKVAKFGLKVVQSVTNVVGHVASFIPAIGKPIQQAIRGVSKAAGAISDHIRAKLSPKLEKGMKIMNKANKVMGFIPRRRDLEEDAFQQRDIGEANYFEERDDISLENREESYFEANERDNYELYDPLKFRRDFSEEEISFQQRNINEAYHFEERDDIALEN